MKTVTTDNIILTIRGLIKDDLKSTGNDSYIYDSSSVFTLSEDHVQESGMKVYQNGSELTVTTEWTYNSDTNQVTVIKSLTKNDVILITYSFYCKYSDTEIKSYIRANLVRFTQYRYSKHFYIDEYDEVVTMDGVNPTVQEGNIIALISAIDIDPQNVETRVVGLFSSTAVESMSKQEQIGDVFTQWLTNYGIVDFLEVE